MYTILVTGSAGFIGANLMLRLLESPEPLKLVGLDNLNDYYDPSLKEARLRQIEDAVIPVLTRNLNAIDYRFVRGDLTNAALLDRLFAEHRFDTVVNLAAQVGVRYSLENPHAYVDSNVTGFLNVLEACRKYEVKHLVFASSSSVYGINAKVPYAETDRTDQPVSPYAATKKCDELLAHVYSQTYGLPVTGLRFFTVYGPWGRPDMAPMLFAKAICAGEPINVFNNGDMLRDFTYVDDVVEGIIRVINRHPRLDDRHSRLDRESQCPDRESYAIYNIGGSNPVKLTEFIAALEAALGRKAVQRFLPMQPGDVPVTYADTSALERDFGFTPRTPLQEGLRKFAEWYKNYYVIPGLTGNLKNLMNN